MKPVKWPWEKNPLDKQIDNLQEQMSKVDVTSPEYQQMLTQLNSMVVLTQKQKSKGKPPRAKVDPNTLLVIGASVVEFVVLANIDQVSVIPGKLMSFILKPKI